MTCYSGQQGSPPRMRGKDAMESLKESGDGITPACAGKSCLNFFHAYSSKDHPRVCGEKMVSMIPHRRSRGSPPRMRGKAAGTLELGLGKGITPAYAGKS